MDHQLPVADNIQIISGQCWTQKSKWFAGRPSCSHITIKIGSAIKLKMISKIEINAVCMWNYSIHFFHSWWYARRPQWNPRPENGSLTRSYQSFRLRIPDRKRILIKGILNHFLTNRSNGLIYISSAATGFLVRWPCSKKNGRMMIQLSQRRVEWETILCK